MPLALSSQAGHNLTLWPVKATQSDSNIRDGQMKRREFLRYTSTGIAATMIPGAMRSSEKTTTVLAAKPPMGWNSFDSYGVYLHEKAALANLEAMAKKLKPFGYEYFVIDNGWFGEYKLQGGSLYPAEKHASDVRLNEFGIVQPSRCYFPNGLAPIVRRARKLGIKVGVHLMRGIPRKAVELNLPIKGTKYRAKDIADTSSTCKWCDYNYGVDMSKSGSQEFYNSLVAQLADWGIDFIKADDIVPFPREVVAMAKAIANSRRRIVLSLSPGRDADPKHAAQYRRANMLRVTHDIWDDQEGMETAFAAWRKWRGAERPGFWIDMDMIPFGQLLVMSPPPISKTTGAKKTKAVRLAGKGYRRWCGLTKPQKCTFITLRALAASPLMFGGDLPSLDDHSLKLVTNKEMIACNQNGVMGKLVGEAKGIEVWKTPQKGAKLAGWIGVFNRTDQATTVTLTLELLGLKGGNPLTCRDIWADETFILSAQTAPKAVIEPNGVIFLRYQPGRI